MGNVSVAVAEGAQRPTGATAAIATTEPPPPVSILSLLVGFTRIRSVDFIVVRDRKLWILVETKKSHRRVSPSLAYFQEQTGAPHALQVVMDAEYVERDCFARDGRPLVVPGRTFLSQLL